MRVQKGFTLIETIIALMILSIILVASLTLLGEAENLNTRQNERDKMILDTSHLLDEWPVRSGSGTLSDGWQWRRSVVPVSSEKGFYRVSVTLTKGKQTIDVTTIHGDKS